jgi:hypothetical protein
VNPVNPGPDIPYRPFREAQSLARAAEVIKYSGGF